MPDVDIIIDELAKRLTENGFHADGATTPTDMEREINFKREHVTVIVHPGDTASADLLVSSRERPQLLTWKAGFSPNTPAEVIANTAIAAYHY